MAATISVITFSILLTTANEQTMTLFHGEDFHIFLPSLLFEITFRNRSSPRSPDVVLMRDGLVLNGRAKLDRYNSHLIVDAVGEGDEGLYTMKNSDNPKDIRHITLIVRDCSHEQILKYGQNYHIPLLGVTPPITLEYRPSAVEANQTSRPALVLLTVAGTSKDGYQGRISVTDRNVTLSDVTGADEGSYTVRDFKGAIRRKVCLNVREHQNYVALPYGKRLKVNLILNSTLVRLYYIADNDPKSHLLMDKGEFTSAVAELGFENRLSVDGPLVFLDEVKRADAGQFKSTDLLDFTVSIVHLEVLPYKLETLYVAIISLLGLLVFLLLVCLVSCLIRIKKRTKRAAALEKIAKNAGKEDEGEAFRQVVKDITKLSEESKHSQADVTEKSQSTEVDIKGLEVSSKEVGLNNLETSDSGVGFNTALPLDTDTDAPDQMSESAAVTVSVAPETKSIPPAAAESQPSAPPSAEMKPGPVAEAKLSPAPSPEPKTTAEPKPASSSNPEPKSITVPGTKATLTPTPESTPEPITNGTPEPGKPSPGHTDIIGVSAPKAAAPKTPDVEVKSSGAALEAKKDGIVAEETMAAT
ncbi:uncharacterized protein si:dkeyp-77h1.4 [Brachionichthys hirsutus]|uniref:uncharacterized protein si:dkeyp-77h1.4 n=1 Tax=Brachionichthys hirsutus TaxID=412623 RepID=UPI003604906C